MRLRLFALASSCAASLACAGGAPPPPENTPKLVPSASASAPPPPIDSVDAGLDAAPEAGPAHASEAPIHIVAHNQHASTAFVTDGYDVIWMSEADGTI